MVCHPLTTSFLRLEQAQIAFRQAMCDSFDTPRGLQIILDLVSATNIYLNRGRANVNVSVAIAVAEWVTRMLRMFGLGEGSPTNARGERVIGWGAAAAPGQEQAGSSDVSVLSKSKCRWRPASER